MGCIQSHDFKDILHACTELETLSKQYCLQTDKANMTSAILKYKQQQKRTYWSYSRKIGLRPNR